MLLGVEIDLDEHGLSITEDGEQELNNLIATEELVDEALVRMTFDEETG